MLARWLREIKRATGAPAPGASRFQVESFTASLTGVYMARKQRHAAACDACARYDLRQAAMSAASITPHSTP